MKQNRDIGTSLVFLALLATTTYAQDRRSAIIDCTQKVTNNGNSPYYKAYDTQARNIGHNSYQVTGKLLSRDDKNRYEFVCDIQDGRITNWNVRNSRGSSSNSNMAVATGIAALATLATAGNSNNNHMKSSHYESRDEYEDRRNNQDSNDLYRGDDRRDYESNRRQEYDLKQLKHQCRRELEDIISEDTRRNVRRVKIDDAYIERGELRGYGYVVFESGRERDFKFKCSLNRRGAIEEASYRFK